MRKIILSALTILSYFFAISCEDAFLSDSNLYIANENDLTVRLIEKETGDVFDAENLYCSFHYVFIMSDSNLPTTNFNFPNPFNDYTLVPVEITTLQNNSTMITIEDLNGKVIDTVLNKKLSVGKYTFEYKPEKMKDGVYLIAIKTGDKVDIMKAVFINDYEYLDENIKISKEPIASTSFNDKSETGVNLFSNKNLGQYYPYTQETAAYLGIEKFINGAYIRIVNKNTNKTIYEHIFELDSLDSNKLIIELEK